jgi:hypothetical protein
MIAGDASDQSTVLPSAGPTVLETEIEVGLEDPGSCTKPLVFDIDTFSLFVMFFLVFFRDFALF